MPTREENKKVVEEFLFPTREMKQRLEALAQEIEHPWWPPTEPGGICKSCQRWTPARHPEAHDHQDGCPAYAERIARLDYPSRLRAIARGEILNFADAYKDWKPKEEEF